MSLRAIAGRGPPGDTVEGRRGGDDRTSRRPTALQCIVVGVTIVVGLADVHVIQALPLARRWRAKNVTARVNIAESRTRTFGSSFVDFDRDGDSDLFLNRHWNPAHFYISRGKSFRRSPEDFVSLPGYRGPTPGQVDRHHCQWGEANGDGRPDLYCTVGAEMGRGKGPNQLVMRRKGRFVDRARRFGVVNRYGRGRSVSWVDFDSDGDLDLFVANDKRSGYPNVMFENRRRGFRRVGVGLDSEMKSLSSTWADWDGDGDPDLVVTRGSIAGWGRLNPVAYRNDQGRFARVRIRGVTDRPWKSIAWADHNDDSRVDLVAVRGRRVAIMTNTGDGFRTEFARDLARGRSVAWFDGDNDGDLDAFAVQGATGTAVAPGPNRPDLLLVHRERGFRMLKDPAFRGPRKGNGETVSASDYDRDGKVDLFVTNGNNPSGWKGRSTLLRNTLLRNTSDTQRWAALDLYGGRRNPLGFGARVEVQVGDRTYWRFLTDGAGYKSQSEVSYVHLGLGRARSGRAFIDWGRGRPDCVRVRARRIKKVRRGASPCHPADNGRP